MRLDDIDDMQPCNPDTIAAWSHPLPGATRTEARRLAYDAGDGQSAGPPPSRKSLSVSRWLP